LKFSDIFDQVLKVQCYLKGICTQEEYEEFKQNIRYDFKHDNHYAELITTQLLQNRLNLLGTVDPYVGKYYSMKWIQENILQFTDEDSNNMAKEIAGEIKNGLYPDPRMLNDPNMMQGQPDPNQPQQGQPDSDQAQQDQQQDSTNQDNP
jgi:hypothetical protein